MKSFYFAARLLVLSIVSAAAAGSLIARADELPMSERAANAAIARWPDGRTVPAGAPWIWKYETGTLLQGMDDVWLNNVDPRYFKYIKMSVDQLLTSPTAPSPLSSRKKISSTTFCSAANFSSSMASRRTRNI